MRPALLAAALALVAPLAQAKSPTTGPRPLVVQRTRLDVKTRGVFRLVHPTRYVQVRCDTERGEAPDVTDRVLVCALVDLQNKAIEEVRLSTAKLHQALGEDFIAGATWRNKAGHTFSTFEVRLASYFPDRGFAGLLVRNDYTDRAAGTWAQRVFYVAWDLASDSMAWRLLLEDFAGNYADRFAHYVRDAGPSADGRTHTVWVAQKIAAPDQPDRQAALVSLRRISLAEKRLAWSYGFQTPASTNPNIHSRLRATPSPDGRLWVFTEYSEKGDGDIDPEPALTVLSAVDGEHFRLPVPFTPYGVAISDDNRWLVIGSNQLGELHRYDLRARKRDRKRKVLRRIHMLALTADGERLLVLANAQAVPVLRFPSLRPAGRIPVRRILEGEKYIAPERGVISADRRYLVMPTTTDDHGFAERSGVHVVELRTPTR